MDLEINSKDEASLGKELLLPILEWVNKNMEIDDVFSRGKIADWLEIGGFERVTEKRLAEWAEANGYVHRSQI